jgi:hypothetical protein
MGYKNKTDQLASQRRWYSNHKVEVVERVLQRRRDLYDWLRKLKRTLKCNRCPESFWVCLDFHHTDPTEKDMSVAQAVRNGWSKKRILAEIAKCEVLCKNCHAKEHAKIGK